ncbi:hypothetical protein CYG49_04480 [Candidatus Saccharibacteria bacterium]|nr:MAG: hypothetical protein CYG49_04480 [Candidatus Saccharibacteria bacterium]
MTHPSPESNPPFDEEAFDASLTELLDSAAEARQVEAEYQAKVDRVIAVLQKLGVNPESKQYQAFIVESLKTLAPIENETLGIKIPPSDETIDSAVADLVHYMLAEVNLIADLVDNEEGQRIMFSEELLDVYGIKKLISAHTLRYIPFLVDKWLAAFEELFDGEPFNLDPASEDHKIIAILEEKDYQDEESSEELHLTCDIIAGILSQSEGHHDDLEDTTLKIFYVAWHAAKNDTQAPAIEDIQTTYSKKIVMEAVYVAIELLIQR